MAQADEPDAPCDNAAKAHQTWDLYTPRRRNMLLAVLFLIGTSNYIDRNIIAVLLEPIKAEFQVSDTMLGLLSGLSFALFYATLGIPVARWADRGNRPFIITLALCVWSLMTALCGLAQSFWQLALARIGVGAGEAGAIPPAQSLIADYYPPDKRARALGIYTLSSVAGAALGMSGGGWLAQNFGWRIAFVVVGLSGFLIAVAARLMLREPRLARSSSHPKVTQENLSDTFGVLLGKASYRNIVISMTIYFLMAYGAMIFFVPFTIRVHGLSVTQAGAVYGLISAFASIIGSVVGGGLADRLARQDAAWLARLPGWGLIVALPFYEAALLAPTANAMAAMLFLGGAILIGVVPPMFAAVQLVCGSARRAMAVAIIYFFANLVGLGAGPVIAGALSDYLAASHGAAEGLRYALMIVMIGLVPSGIFMLRASRDLAADAEAEDADALTAALSVDRSSVIPKR